MKNYGIYTDDLPQLEVVHSGGIYQIMFNFEHVEHDESDDQKHYMCDMIEVPTLDYATIISAIIRGRYSQDDVEAIISNYQLCKDNEAGDKSDEYMQSYTVYQNYRTAAKHVANNVLNR